MQDAAARSDGEDVDRRRPPDVEDRLPAREGVGHGRNGHAVVMENRSGVADREYVVRRGAPDAPERPRDAARLQGIPVDAVEMAEDAIEAGDEQVVLARGPGADEVIARQDRG